MPSVAVVVVPPFPERVMVAPVSGWPVERSVTVPLIAVVPVPVRVIAAVSVPNAMLRVAVPLPMVDGVKITSKEQESPASMGWVEHVSLEIEKSFELLPVILIDEMA